jgi:riboflavin synthase
MFSGIVEARGAVAEVRPEPPGCRLMIRDAAIAAETSVADSICVNGCCLTVVAVDGDTMAFQAGPETLARTNLGDLRPGGLVNLERALAVGGRLGGHFVSGHIDGLAVLEARHDHGDWSSFWFRIPRALGRQMASKGSVAVDGVSLTLDEGPFVRTFTVTLIPQTLRETRMGSLKAGDRVNLEIDVIAKAAGRSSRRADRTFVGSEPLTMDAILARGWAGVT